MRPGALGAALLCLAAACASCDRGRALTGVALADPQAGRGGRFGISIATDGTTVIIGSLGAGGRGSACASSLAPSAGASAPAPLEPGQSPRSEDRYGCAVAVSGEWAFVGSSGSMLGPKNCGAVRAFRRGPGGAWAEAALLLPSDPWKGQAFGASLAAEGTELAVGSPGSDAHGSNAGEVYLFRLGPSGAWTPEARLRAGHPVLGSRFGTAVALSGELCAVGEPGESEGMNAGGSAWIFGRQADGSWAEEAELQPESALPGASFGAALALSCGRLAVAAPGEGGGRLRIYGKKEGAWEEEAELPARGCRSGDFLGLSLAFDADELWAGAPGTSGGGAVLAFERGADGSWRGRETIRSPEGRRGGLFGYALASAGGYLAVGASAGAGAAYLFKVR